MMHLVTMVSVAWAFAAVAAPDAPAQQDDQRMQGTWAIESLVNEGEAAPPETVKTWRRIVKDNHVAWKRGDETLVELTIKFDPQKRPKTLDSTIAAGDDKGKTMLAIYELNDDELRVCFAPPGKPRPKDFSSTPGSEQLLYTARRIKP